MMNTLIQKEFQPPFQFYFKETSTSTGTEQINKATTIVQALNVVSSGDESDDESDGESDHGNPALNVSFSGQRYTPGEIDMLRKFKSYVTKKNIPSLETRHLRCFLKKIEKKIFQ